MMRTTMKAAMAFVLSSTLAAAAAADDGAKSISLRVGGREIALEAGARDRIAALSRAPSCS